MSSTPTSTPVKRACDSCHRRKVKCIGEGTKPCKNCISAGLNCTYNAIPQKKGPKGSRAKVLSELRETQRNAQMQAGAFGDHFANIALQRQPGLMSLDLIHTCVDFFFANMYPSQPILHHQRIQEAIMTMDQSVEAYCLISALCAYMLIQPNLQLSPHVAPRGPDGNPVPNLNFGIILLEESVRVRKGYNHMENPTRYTVITSFFYFSSYLCLDKHNTGWYYLREATTHAQLLGMHDEETYKTGDFIETSRRRRLFWLLFIQERAYALHKHRPITLDATIELPTMDEDPTERVQLSGFLHLINLYKPFDHTFIGLWNKVRTGCLPAWLAQMQQQLSEALPTYLESTEVQAVDLRTSQQWLRTMVWQLSISHGFISSMATDNTMSFKYPIEIARDLITMSSQFSQQAMEVHGVGLIEKLFDVACTLTDVMACVPLDQNSFEIGPRDYLGRFLGIISTLRGGHSRYLALLLQKINEVLPNMAVPMPRGVSANSTPTNPRLDELYESSASVSAQGSHVGSHEATPFDSPPPMSIPVPVRQSSHGNMPYPEMQVTPPLVPQQPGFPTFSTAMGFPQTTTAGPPPPAVYQAQHSSHGGFPG
ncbi:uncharacterized protein K452DRAFT_308737 [Aplosporella prunicola CBS 121167]|uniref:Zn(2)-C6 fungal-type domain-containing protein n=1 Tax=Aplosporella prunicola CBS 121167 TaxID=1176127 RepID=A0A6A6BEF4_9PEZI|nr:uncharacterized protein K452DRAFT_308737 [Aplosporella prunicola CBS 121167]KAF2141654.1 hypothetical protein K452DRAFT_308737 [Aplosporella prunicola CBS 121167]